MELKLLHLYGDVMNLYGEYANVAVLAQALTDMGHTVAVETLSLYEQRDISGYDFYYMGAGTERLQKLALSQLLSYRAALESACTGGKTMLFTGNSFELLGQSVTDAQGKRYEGLGIGSFESVETTRRITGDCLARFSEVDETLVGFINKCSKTVGVTTPFLSLQMGFGNEAEKGDDGFRREQCFGTHLIGPLLVKNPAMLRFFARLLVGKSDAEVPLSDAMEKGYEITKKELLKRLETLK